MTLVPTYRYELQHHEAPLGVVRAGGIDWISDAANDEAMFWLGWRGIERERARRRPTLKQSPWMIEALRAAIRRNACAVAASNSRG